MWIVTLNWVLRSQSPTFVGTLVGAPEAGTSLMNTTAFEFGVDVNCAYVHE